MTRIFRIQAKHFFSHHRGGIVNVCRCWFCFCYFRWLSRKVKFEPHNNNKIDSIWALVGWLALPYHNIKYSDSAISNSMYSAPSIFFGLRNRKWEFFVRFALDSKWLLLKSGESDHEMVSSTNDYYEREKKRSKLFFSLSRDFGYFYYRQSFLYYCLHCIAVYCNWNLRSMAFKNLTYILDCWWKVLISWLAPGARTEYKYKIRNHVIVNKIWWCCFLWWWWWWNFLEKAESRRLFLTTE